MQTNIQGAGLGFRREILNDLYSANLSCVDFFEVAPENWINLGGKYQNQLRHFTERFPFACHGLSLSIGGTDPLDVDLLQNTRKLMDTHNIQLYTEHLSWCAQEGQLYDLLPITFTQDAALWVAQRIKQAQDILNRPIGIENASYYIVPPGAEMTEQEFIKVILEESGCFLHLDVNNLYVNSQNLKYDPIAFLNSFRQQDVGYMHVAGHYVEEDGWIVDTHGANVIDPVWQLLQTTYQWLGTHTQNIGTCLERDFNFPPIPELLKEVSTIKNLQETQSTTHVNTRPNAHINNTL